MSPTWWVFLSTTILQEMFLCSFCSFVLGFSPSFLELLSAPVVKCLFERLRVQHNIQCFPARMSPSTSIRLVSSAPGTTRTGTIRSQHCQGCKQGFTAYLVSVSLFSPLFVSFSILLSIIGYCSRRLSMDGGSIEKKRETREERGRGGRGREREIRWRRWTRRKELIFETTSWLITANSRDTNRYLTAHAMSYVFRVVADDPCSLSLLRFVNVLLGEW